MAFDFIPKRGDPSFFCRLAVCPALAYPVFHSALGPIAFGLDPAFIFGQDADESENSEEVVDRETTLIHTGSLCEHHVVGEFSVGAFTAAPGIGLSEMVLDTIRIQANATEQGAS